MNTAHVIEIALLVLAAFLLGCVIGYLLRRIFAPGGPATQTDEQSVTTRRSEVITSAATGAASAAGLSGITETPRDPGNDEDDAETEPASGEDKAEAADEAKDAGQGEAPKPSDLDAAAEADARAGAGSRPKGLSAPRGGKKDDLKQIKGIGPKIEDTLNGLGIFHFDQIAVWDRKTIDWVDSYLSFKGRIDREEWVSQAKELSGS
jgi:NADH-quinone oxidoreductase subunit E